MRAQPENTRQWQHLDDESDASKAASLSFAILLHAALVALMYVGFATASIPPSTRAGKPIEFMLMDLPKAPVIAKKPTPAQHIPVPKPPKPQAAKPDDVTDHKPIVEPVKIPDPLAIEEQPDEVKPRPEEQARSELDKLLDEQAEAAKKTEAIRRKMEQAQDEADALALAQAVADAATDLKGDTEDNSLLGQYQSAIQSTIEARSQLSRSLRPGVLCWLRVTQLPGGEVMSATPLAKCNASEQERAELIEGVMRASPLPYSGFESVFDRLVDVPFEPAKE